MSHEGNGGPSGPEFQPTTPGTTGDCPRSPSPTREAPALTPCTDVPRPDESPGYDLDED
jgi:hypothetical protein